MATVTRIAAVVLSAVLGAASAVTVGATPAQAAQHRDAHMYAYWNFNGANGFWNVDQQVRIATKAHHTYWAMNWGFTVTPNEGGYMGLQTNGIRFDGSTGETAIFSLWNANAASGSGCGRFGGEGVGYSCRVPYAFSTGVYYRYRLWRLNTDAGGQWWGAWMQNTATGADTHLGSIRVAAAKTLTTTPMNFTEYWGEAAGCDNVPVSVAYYTQPAANSRGGNTYQYGSVFASSYRGPCTGGSTTGGDRRDDPGGPDHHGWPAVGERYRGQSVVANGRRTRDNRGMSRIVLAGGGAGRPRRCPT